MTISSWQRNASRSGNVAKRNPRTGSRFDDFLKKEGIFEEVQAKALKRALAEQLQESMQAAKLTKLDMAKKMATSRSQLDRVLDPSNVSVQLDTLVGAAGRRARAQVPDHDRGRQRRTTAGSRQSAIRGDPSQSALGSRLHVRRDVDRIRVRGVRDRRVRASYHRLARVALDARRVGSRCIGAGDLVALWHRGCGASQRSRQPISVDPVLERLAEAGAQPSVGSVGDSYDNALAETIIGLFKTEVIHHRGPWRTLGSVEYATLEWVDWFNHRRLLEPIGNIPPAELEATYHQSTSQLPMAA
jgi:integrase-like protein